MGRPHDDSPLALIRHKEREFSQELQAARRAAQAIITQARQRATAIKQEAEGDGRRAAEAYCREELDKTERLAAHIKAAGQEEAQRLLQAGRRRLGRAVQAIIEFVLPT